MKLSIFQEIQLRNHIGTPRDNYINSLKERSDYLDKYLNM
jgi:hypothetical protein